jgi:hypothetical protein
MCLSRWRLIERFHYWPLFRICNTAYGTIWDYISGHRLAIIAEQYPKLFMWIHLPVSVISCIRPSQFAMQCHNIQEIQPSRYVYLHTSSMTVNEAPREPEQPPNFTVIKTLAHTSQFPIPKLNRTEFNHSWIQPQSRPHILLCFGRSIVAHNKIMAFVVSSLMFAGPFWEREDTPVFDTTYGAARTKDERACCFS